MKVIGIIAEYNPFHLGHLYQIRKIKEMNEDSIIVAIVSSSFTQRGEVSIINKWNKTNVILDNGVDIVIELPFLYATQSADNFAYGAISILNKLGIDTLVFGTESDNINVLKEIAMLQLYNNDYDGIVKNYLNKGLNYPTSMSLAINEILGYKIDTPNDLLALSYIKQIYKINKEIEVINIKRTNDYHSKDVSNNIIPASLIREYLLDNKDVSKYLPIYNTNLLYKNFSNNNYFAMLKYQVINNIDNLSEFLDVDEGIENRILNVINYASSWNELVSLIKTKRYTYNKVNRMLIHILCGLKKKDVRSYEIDYVRVLGFTKSGQRYLNTIKKDIGCRVITSYRKNVSTLLDLEYKVNYIYSLIADNKLIMEEFRHKPIIKN